MAAARKHVLVRGRVQGVCFRAGAAREGERLGVAGWVRNLADGRVEAVLEGEEADVARMLEWLRRGPALARVDGVEVTDEEPRGDLEGFRTR